MEKRDYLSNSAEDTKKGIVEKVLEEVDKNKINVVLLQGELGAGKTTFSQGILETLGAEGPYTSPTFVIMKRYQLKRSQSTKHKSQISSKPQISNPKFNFVYHFDCYRVSPQDVLELGWEETIANPQNLVLVEWPEKIENILPKNVIKLNFNIVDETRRKILISKE